MFIRRTQTRNRISGEPYVTYRLVQTSRVGKSVKQATVLNLGSHFDLPQAHWPSLAQRIDELVSGQAWMLDAALPEHVQAFAQRFAAQILARKPAVPSLGSPAPVRAKTPAAAAAKNPSSRPISPASEVARYQEVDLDSLELVDPRSVGVEQAALSAMRQCGLEDKLSELGLNRPQIAAALGNIVGRMAQPGSELATHAWLGDTSALGELIDHDFQAMDLNRLYRASDLLYKHREALQEHLFGCARSMFGLGQTITLYDLILHRRGDRIVLCANGRYLADHIPAAVYLELPGEDHFAPEGDAGAIVDAVGRFAVADWVRTPEHPADRWLATVLFTDIVGSTELAARLGDRAWRDVLQQFHAIGRAQIEAHRGREIDTAGDGFFATFDGPARAIRCAAAIAREVQTLGIELRAGLHTGEVEATGDKVSGMAVHIGARVMAQAGSGEVWVSNTVKDLVAGSGIRFEARGSHALKGVPGEWPLWRAFAD